MRLVRTFQEVLAFKLRHFVINDILIQWFYSLVYPFLTYGLIVWGNTYATTLNAVVVLQKNAVLIIIYSNRHAHSSPLFSHLGLIKLMDLDTALFMFQFHYHLLPKAFDNFFSLISSKHGHNTKLASNTTCYIEQVTTNYGKFNIHFSGPCWKFKKYFFTFFQANDEGRSFVHILLMLASMLVWLTLIK